MASSTSAQPPVLDDLRAVTPITNVLSSNPEDFLGPSALLFTQSAAALKHYLDSLASSTSQLQERQQLLERRHKRKRSGTVTGPSSKKLQLREVHINGFNVRQVWEQAQRVLKTSSEVTKEHIVVEPTGSRSKKNHASDKSSASESDDEDMEFDNEDGSETDLTGDEDGDEDTKAFSGFSDEEEEENEKEGEQDDEEIMDLKRPKKDKDENNAIKQPAPFVRDRHGLNDGFFSIDEFNKQSMLFEEMDAKRAKNDDYNSDEENVDWDADPFVLGDAGSDEEEGDEDENEGDDEDLVDEAMDEDLDMDDLDDDARNATYDQFFDAPDSEHMKKEALDKKKTSPTDLETDLDADVQRAMADVHRDLFDDEDSDVGDEDETSHRNSKDSDAIQSTHEKTQAKIMDEIRKLEAANVAKKEWTLTGEARGVDRPMNSLIEEDLEFERVGKPVPVITAEITDDIEALIKRRIVAKEFDDLLRRPPPGLGDYSQAKSKFVLEETKSQQNLAELYEADHLRATDQNYVSKTDAKLQKERDEITQLWNNICSQLDSLTNLHFRPKQPSANIRVVADVDTIVMEDVRPSGGDGLTSAGTLAPQEVYAPGEKGRTGEVVLKSGTAVAKDEMSREEKLRHRRREKQKKRKRALGAPEKPESTAAKKQQLVSNLGKGGVKIIGKDGALMDVRGQKVATEKSTVQQGLKL